MLFVLFLCYDGKKEKNITRNTLHNTSTSFSKAITRNTEFKKVFRVMIVKNRFVLWASSLRVTTLFLSY